MRLFVYKIAVEIVKFVNLVKKGGIAKDRDVKRKKRLQILYQIKYKKKGKEKEKKR